jgi:two-component system, NarL family, nitrate/nitrite response regulator NarL
VPDIVLGEDPTAGAATLAPVLVDGGRRFRSAGPATLLATALEHVPDLLVIDGRLTDALELLPALAEASPRTRILVVGVDHDRRGADETLAAGAHGYVHRSRGAAALLDAVARVLAGEEVVDLPPRWTAGRRPRAHAAPGESVGALR